MPLKKFEPGTKLHLADEAATLEIGRQCGESLEATTVIALVGDLGAGKTSLSKGIASGLEYAGDVSSPTFTLVHEYVGGRLPVFHFDLYRLDTVEQLWDIGWDEYLSSEGVIIAEWADKFPTALPPETVWVRLSHSSATDAAGGREFEILKPQA
ncbi:MAG: tRNA threonylcarbamoyladenosine biosynthesis protein TsaE [Verrucomicrobiales bacterium]|jgi:tRNA threonylcarbamoyladenosine biosynthesis protein TsaE